MGKALVVVESPTKVKTLSKYLGRGFTVKASVGHVIDLPKSKLGVEIGERFEPVYEVIKGKQKILNDIRAAAKGAEKVFLASDPDREGEAIAWHIARELRGGKKAAAGPKIFRVLVNEITKKGVERAFAAPGELNKARYEAQQARRILDRLVGYQVSPILWEKVQRGLSAGRVQSVALRIVVEREREIRKFVAVEYWSVDVQVAAKNPPVFHVRLITRNEEKLSIDNEGEAKKIQEDLSSRPFVVTEIQKQTRKRTPPPAFTTSKLQQDAARKLGFSPKRTMMIAQQLYEGAEIGEEGAVGLITYMRTDSTRLSDEALASAREFIAATFGSGYLPESPRLYRLSKKSQDAHEAIRPSSIEYPPERVAAFLKKEQLSLYRLIWDRYIACQMNEAVYDQNTVYVSAGEYGLRATGTKMAYDGFMRVYVEAMEDVEPDEEENEKLPEVEIGEKLKVEKILPDQHFTKPPARFTEAGLVKELEEDGIGRPSTYASILSTLQDRKYAAKEQGRIAPTELGFIICDLLVENFPTIMDVTFTAQMEEKLDQVEEGERDWQEILHEFYKPFGASVKTAKKKMRDLKGEETPTEHKCEKCASPMVIKWGRNGYFLACSGYPECKNTKEFRRLADGKIEIVREQPSDEKCELCGSQMMVKNGRFGKFLACTRYPDCKHTRSISTGVHCPEKGCEGVLVEKRSRYGKPFYGCSKYPACKHASWHKPVSTPCPQCGAPYLVEKYSKRDGNHVACVKKECGYNRSTEETAA